MWRSRHPVDTIESAFVQSIIRIVTSFVIGIPYHISFWKFFFFLDKNKKRDFATLEKLIKSEEKPRTLSRPRHARKGIVVPIFLF